MDVAARVHSLRSDPATRWRAAVAGVLALGVLLRVAFWLVYPPDSRLHAGFTPLDVPVLEYVGDLQGYKASRMPFFDVLVAASHVLLGDLLGYRALALVAVLFSVAGLPLFYGAVRRLFDRRVALLGLLLFAFHPQGLVLAGRGYPEASSAATVVASLYAVARGLDSGWVWWYLAGGLAALLAYLLYVPAVVFGVLATGYLYLRQVDAGDLAGLLPDRGTVAYALPPGVVGVVYLFVGPVATITSRNITEGDALPYIFVSEAYTFTERVVRYVAIAYFDFWWHLPGFDHERHVLQLLSGLEVFLGAAYPVYLAGWAAITLGLTAVLAVGAWRLLSRRSLLGGFVLAWIVAYVAVWNLKNLGWTGGFNTRHVYPVFPAVCVVFGVGLARVARSGLVGDVARRVRDVMPAGAPRVSGDALVAAFVVLALAVLVVNGGVQGQVQAEKHEVYQQRPVAGLASVADPGDAVAVADSRLYEYTLIYTGGDLRPALFVEGAAYQHVVDRKALADVRVVEPADLHDQDVEYLLLRNFQCRDLTPRMRGYVEAVENGPGEVVVHETFRRPGFRCSNFETYVLRIE